MEADTISGQRHDDDAGALGGGDGVDALFGRRVRLQAARRGGGGVNADVTARLANDTRQCKRIVTHGVACAPHAG